MTEMTRRYAFMGSGAVLSMGFSRSALGQSNEYPTKPVRIVMGMPPGGLADTLARAFSRDLNIKWNVPVLVENRPGASGIVAAKAMSTLPADGTAILLVNSLQFITAAYMQAQPPYDPLKGFEPVMGLAEIRDVLVVNNNLGVSSLDGLVELARKRPGQLSYGTFGLGSAAHLMAAELALQKGLKAKQIDYRGGPEVLKAVAQGEVDFAFTGTSPAIPLIRDRVLTGIGYDGPVRHPDLPDVPTMKEQGYNLVTGGWFGLLAAPGTPAVAKTRLQEDLGAILKGKEFQERWIASAGLEPMFVSAQELQGMIVADAARYRSLIEKLNLQAP